MSDRLINLSIGAGLVLILVFLIGGYFSSAYNGAVRQDEAVRNSKSAVSVQEKRRFDLITKLVQVVEENAKFEKTTLKEVIEMRKAVSTGNIDKAQLAINAVAEAYPQLKANESYKQLMTELSVTENMIAEYRKSYNSSINEYRQYVRTFPRNIALSIMGYTMSDYVYLEFESTDLPDQLFTK